MVLALVPAAGATAQILTLDCKTVRADLANATVAGLVMNAMLGFGGQALLKGIEWLPSPRFSNRRSMWAVLLGFLQLAVGGLFVALLIIAIRQIGPFDDVTTAAAAIALAGTGMLIIYANVARCFIKSVEWMI